MKRLVLPFTFFVMSVNGFSQNVLFQNHDGFLSVGTPSNRTTSISLVDLDKDGDLDASIANGRHWAEQNYIYYNDGLSDIVKSNSSSWNLYYLTQKN